MNPQPLQKIVYICIILLMHNLMGSEVAYNHCFSTTIQHNAFHFTALSHQGRIDFASPPRYQEYSNIAPASQSAVHEPSPTYSAAFNAGPIAVSCGTDPFSCFNLVRDTPQILSALLKEVITGLEHWFDTTGKYQNKERVRAIENFLYAVDAHRFALYANNPYHDAINKDFTYLADLRQEIMIAIATRTTPPGCYHAYCNLESIITDAWRMVTNHYVPTPEKEIHNAVRMARNAVNIVTNAQFKSKQEKFRAIAHYAQALNLIEKQLAQFQENQAIQSIFNSERTELIAYCEEQQEIISNNELHAIDQITRVKKRIDILHTTQLFASTQQYTLSSDALKSVETDAALLLTNTGNAYQQRLHQELISIIESTAQIPESSPVHLHRETIIACSMSAVEYNQAGYAYHATRIVDFCWAFLDYGSAAVEGIVIGLSSTTLNAGMHPFETAASVYMGQYMLAYQLSSLLYSVLDIGITASYDSKAASVKWEELLNPITTLYDHLTSAEVSTHDKIRTATTLLTSLYAQTKLIGGLKKFCTNITKQITLFRQNNPQATPQQYLSTPEGLIINTSREAYLEKTCETQQTIQNEITCNIRTGSALKKDSYHAFSDLVDNYAHTGNKFEFTGNDGIKRTLYQVQGSLDNVDGIFEWILDPRTDKGITHRLFIPKGTITGKPNVRAKK